MIVSITCRHGTGISTKRNEVRRELLALSKCEPVIARARVIFSKETHHITDRDLVSCHLSIYIPNKHQVDIYERQPTEMQAFNRAKERAIKQIMGKHSPRNISRKHCPVVQEIRRV